MTGTHEGVRKRREEKREQALLNANGGSVSTVETQSVAAGHPPPTKPKPKNPMDFVPPYLPADFDVQRTRVWPVGHGQESPLARLQQMREDVVQWSRGWGGIECWSVQLDYSYRHAVDDEGPLTPRWRESLFHHVRSGREMLAKLQSYDGDLGDKPWMLHEMWRLRIDRAERLIRGITILELKTSILPGMCNVDREWDEESAASTETSDDEYDNAGGEDSHEISDADEMMEEDIDADEETDNEFVPSP
ncbi:hypothetical protein H0H93_015935 [Arthromyces matolae]|nr:hypothetical protein H0H93_015935 [Arthromyces matolae]